MSRRVSTTTHSASRSTGKLKIRRRADRWAPSALVALTGASSGTTASARRAADSCGPASMSMRPTGPSAMAPQSAVSGDHVAGSLADPGDAVHRRRQQSRDRRRRIVRLHGGLRDRARQQVQSELGQRRQERERRGEWEQAERQQQRGQVAEVAPVQRRRVVAALERGDSGRREVGHDHERSDQRDRAGHDCDHGSRSRLPIADRVPDSHRCDRQPDVLLGRQSRRREQGERQQLGAGRGTTRRTAAAGRRARRDGSRSRSATGRAGRGGTRPRAPPPRARSRDAPARARRRGSRPQPRPRPGRRAAVQGSARATTAARAARGSGRSASPAARSARRGRR